MQYHILSLRYHLVKLIKYNTLKKNVQHEVVPLLAESAVIVREFNYKSLDVEWHFHPEIEITFIRQGQGKRIIGNNISLFQDRDLVLIGSDVPHLYRGEESYSQPPSGANCLVIHISKKLLNERALHFIELQPLKQLLHHANHGIAFGSTFTKKVKANLINISKQKGMDQFFAIFQLLYQMAKTEDCQLLNHEMIDVTSRVSLRDQQVFKYILEHYCDNIEVAEVSALANLSKSAFCNYFRKKTKKTFSSYINELKCSFSAKLLKETDLNISEIAAKAGYMNQAYFNRKFKSFYQVTPQEYRN